MKNLIKKLLSVRNRRKILRFLNKTWRAFCSVLPLRNVVLFYSVRADGKLLENAKAVYDALENGTEAEIEAFVEKIKASKAVIAENAAKMAELKNAGKVTEEEAVEAVAEIAEESIEDLIEE